MKSIEAAIMSAIPHDKCLHFIVGVLVFAAIHFVTWQLAIAAVVLVGVLKELLDHFTAGDVSAWDLAATLSGGLVGLLCFTR
ncbi:hypothetical protein SAMN02787142_0726 [Burkholderia sp. WP9]|uniref:hypothetical protein n=1 Tax=Burkholderia sp. WP9 TaxID=1500263 RepID=UPI0008975C03|nr:hypothetical protein [Burkholderia sp. WP9]SEC01713.1 hypothetical protein SAMN02787142_0726 [Burkholderia sp. WP9]